MLWRTRLPRYLSGVTTLASSLSSSDTSVAPHRLLKKGETLGPVSWRRVSGLNNLCNPHTPAAPFYQRDGRCTCVHILTGRWVTHLALQHPCSLSLLLRFSILAKAKHGCACIFHTTDLLCMWILLATPPNPNPSPFISHSDPTVPASLCPPNFLLSLCHPWCLPLRTLWYLFPPSGQNSIFLLLLKQTFYLCSYHVHIFLLSTRP